MDLLSGSPVPNALALLCVVLATVMAFVKRKPLVGLGFLVVVALVGYAILTKNLQYSWIVVEHNGENSLAAHQSFAGVLTFVWIAEAAAGVLAGVLALAARQEQARFFGGLAMFACFWAALSMYDWANVYYQQDPLTPVHYVAVVPVLHWVAVTPIVVMLVIGGIDLVKDLRPRAQG